MKREILAKALSDLDDDFIVEARQTPFKSVSFPAWPLTAAAALLALTFLWTVWNQPALVAHTQGQIITTAAIDLGDLSALPMPTKSAPSISSAITLTLELELNKTHQINAQDGSISVRDKSGKLLLEEGSSLEVKGAITLDWTIDSTQKGPFYLSFQRDGKTIEFMLTREVPGSWQLQQTP